MTPPLQSPHRRLALGAMAALGAGSLATAAPAAGNGDAPATFVLVHGAWHGGWC